MRQRLDNNSRARRVTITEETSEANGQDAEKQKKPGTWKTETVRIGGPVLRRPQAGRQTQGARKKTLTDGWVGKGDEWGPHGGPRKRPHGIPQGLEIRTEERREAPNRRGTKH